jgi:hypothetical protein
VTQQHNFYRYQLVHAEEADFVAYQWKSEEGVWLTVSVWMIPQTAFR